jgi:hypothetical protein
MRTVRQTIVIAILLVATYSCKKENAASSALNTTSRTTSSASAGIIQDTEELIGFGSPVGNWILHYDWGCKGVYSSRRMTVNADGTFYLSGGGGVSSGTWIEGRGIFMFNFNAPARTTYSGTERINRVVGIMSPFGTPNAVATSGCFYMERATSATFKVYDVPGMPDATGSTTVSK